jgi:purine-nucleoside phosphorylase
MDPTVILSQPDPIKQTSAEMTVHIGAKAGDIAETVLLPGDPYRARWAAQTYLENPVLVNEVRGMLGYTGTWRGHRVCPACRSMPMN